ncbi:unnamed protein product [Trichobilharzia szidati]|nr:unnamed protein product [Trichobilharzia szidati]
MEYNGVQEQHADKDHIQNGSVSTESECTNNDTDITRPNSADSSQQQNTNSCQSSSAAISVEERLRRVRAAEQLRQQQRYAAYVEAQRQAEVARMRLQEERKRKIEEMRQKEQKRRLDALERRAALEMSNQARIDAIRERSAIRFGNSTTGRRHTEKRNCGRTSSASPSLGVTRNPSSLMTTSCVVAFGSSSPRSICTQPSPAALRLKQTFEARLASYLTGRHSGCFFTATATPYYSCFIDPSHVPRPPTCVYKSRLSNRGVVQSRRAASAHASVLRQHKSSFTRVTHARRQQTPLANKNTIFKSGQSVSTKDSKSPNTSTISDGHNSEYTQTSEVPNRSSSSNECDKIGRPNYRGTLNSHRSTTPTVPADTIRPIKNLQTTKRNNSARIPPLMSKSVSGDSLHQRTRAKPILPSKPRSPPASTSKTQEFETDLTNLVPPPKSDNLETNTQMTDNTASKTRPADKSVLPVVSGEVINNVESAANVIPQVGPITAETHRSGEGAVLPENEAAIYRAKLVEQRRLAKERMEEEQRRMEEQNRIKKEQERLAAEEEERLRKEEAQRAIEARKAAERQAEEERLKKKQQIEEERVMLKKKLDSIMSRVKRPVGTGPVSTSELPTANISDMDSSVTSAPAVNGTQTVNSKEEVNTQDLNAVANNLVTPTVNNDKEVESRSTFEIPNTVVRPPSEDDTEIRAGSSSTDTEEPHPIDSLTSQISSLDVNQNTHQTAQVKQQCANAPIFKSALLQSMLGGGRLSTRAKDAVAGLRRNSSSVSEDTLKSNICHIPNNQDGASLNNTIIHEVDEDSPTKSVVSVQRSFQDASQNGHDNLPHCNGSNGIENPITSSQQSNEEASALGSMPSLPFE